MPTRALFACGLLLVLELAAPAAAEPASQFVPLPAEPPAELFVDEPLAGPLARGTVIIPYRTKNFRILPIFGAGALDVSPRAGHLHVSVDDLPWRWADAGNTGSVVVNGLPPGPHKVLIELALPDHRVVASQSITFTIPSLPSTAAAHRKHHR